MYRPGKYRALEMEEEGSPQGQSGRPRPACTQIRAQTKTQADCMAQPASLSQEATSCGTKSRVSGDQGLDPVLPQDSGGSDLVQFPSILRTLLPHLYCSGLGVKGLCSHGPWGSSIVLSMSSPQNFPQGKLPQWVLSHKHRKGLGKGPLLLSSARSHYQDPFTPPSTLCSEPGSH